MLSKNGFLKPLVLFGLLVSATLPASATTLIRAGLDELTDANQAIVMGEVIDSYSYWNSDGTFILTDVRVEVLDVLKGTFKKKADLTITLMGGTVGDLTTLILGGAELVPGASYVLFLNEETLPGEVSVLTVRDHCQGVFEVVDSQGELMAVSQASAHPLFPDAQGIADAPGGLQGVSLDAMVRTVRDRLANSSSAPRR